MITTNAEIPVLPGKAGNNDTIFLNKLWSLIAQHSRKPGFGVQQLAQYIQLSRVQLNRKTINLTGYSAGKLIMYYRMQIAKTLLCDGQESIQEIAWKCGFQRQGNFCRSFHLTFRYSPSDYRNTFKTSRHLTPFTWKVPLNEEDYTHLLQLAHQNTWLRQLLSEVILNLSCNFLTIKQLAAAACMSPCSLNRRVKELFGVTTQRFIRDLRLQYAIELINSGFGSVAEIAYQCGFYDPAHMCRCFKKVLGCQPSAYRHTLSQMSIHWLENKLMYQNDK